METPPARQDLSEVAPQPRSPITRRAFLTLGAGALGGMALYAGEVSRHEISIETRTLHLRRLPDAFRGMRIVQISDFHFAEYTEAFFLRDVVHAVNRLRPDIVVLTGDFISYGPLSKGYARRHMPECASILGGIQCSLRYASLGNHDAIVGPSYVIGPLQEHDIPVLYNASVALERGGQRIWLVGLGSACERESHPAAAMPRIVTSSGEAVILLAHEPDILPGIARNYRPDLMLSGHTHGGQVRFPFLPAMHLPPLGRDYVEGLFRYGPTQLYVNRGIGAVGIPFRFFCPPEVTVFTLA